jgi:hypothetical protein
MWITVSNVLIILLSALALWGVRFGWWNPQPALPGGLGYRNW